MRQKLNSLLADYRLAESQEIAEGASLKKAKRKVELISEAQVILQTIAADIQDQAHARIARIATRCLKAVFGPDSYELRIQFERKRGKTEARLLLVKGNLEIEPIDAAGGGVVDVLSFSLRVAALILSRPAKRKLLVLDEPFKHVSDVYRPAVRSLIEALSEEMGIQFILVTHSRELMIGKVINLGEQQ